jgi:hypothetical protein
MTASPGRVQNVQRVKSAKYFKESSRDLKSLQGTLLAQRRARAAIGLFRLVQALLPAGGAVRVHDNERT